MKRYFSCIGFALLLFSIGACTKHAGDLLAPDEPAQAVLNVAQPTAGGEYRPGDTVRIVAEAIAPATIHGYDVAIVPVNDSTRLFYAQVHQHNDTLQISHFWVNDQAAAKELEVRITLTLDHEGNTLVRRIPFRVL
ncbi:MAG: hypothetical protein EOO16_00170 [Chitinophagaceae bacterium]|nr:MAG: hypothetical protein EOO16_00170 [Chitinophagaceae bacterium]